MAFKKNIKTKIAVTAMTLCMAGSLCACGGGGYMSPVDDWMSFVNKRKADPLDSVTVMLPGFSAKDFESYMSSVEKVLGEEYEDVMDDVAETIEDAYDNAEDEFEGWKISFEEKSATELKSKELKEYNEYISDYYDEYLEDQVDELEDMLSDGDELEDMADELDISEKEAKTILNNYLDYMKAYEDIEATEGYEVKGKFILKSDGDEYKTDYVKFIVLKIDGSWVYWGLTEGSLRFEDDDENVFSFFFSKLRYASFYNDDFDL
jgi:hypothetical protein